MKTWITYIAALLMGLATALIFGDDPSALSVLSAASSFIVNLGVCIAIPVIAMTFASGTASLGKDRKGCRAAAASVLWTAATTIALSLAAVAVSAAIPTPFPVTSTAGNPQGMLSGHVSYMLSSSLSAVYPRNAFLTLASATYFIVPAIIVSWVFGLALRPSSDIIRPAYTVMNSFSEVMYRVSRTYSVYGFFIVFVASASMFTDIYQEKTLFAAPGYAILLSAAAAAAVLGVLPLLFAVFTGFRKNPYRVLCRAIAPMLMGLSSSSLIAAIPLSESVSRNSLGVQKRASSVTVPLLSVIGKGGSAFISVLVLLPLYQATTGTIPSLAVIAATAGAAALISFISSASAGTEIVLITVLSLEMLGINLYGAENAVIALIPVLGGLGTMIDALVTAYGSCIAASAMETDIEVPYRDTI